MINDSLLYSNEVKEAFTQNAKYLTLVDINDIILIMDKFVFFQKSVYWAGIRITKNRQIHKNH